MPKIFAVYDFQYTGHESSITLRSGTYLFECWGASGTVRSFEEIETDGCKHSNGFGGYVRGYIKLNATTTFYVYVGEYGRFEKKAHFNCNNKTAFNGGGATDIRLVGGNWFDFQSLKSRIIVAGAGGTGERICGGDGGGLNGTSSPIYYIFPTSLTTGGTQTSGGLAGYSTKYGSGASGTFGMGGDGSSYGEAENNQDSGGAGGGGYYGGGGVSYAGSGAGGSSFISGHEGCDAITESSTENHIIHSHQPIHYSGYSFYQTEMIAGNQYMLSPTFERVLGHSGNGFARITSLTPFYLSKKSSSFNLSPLAYLFLTYSYSS